MKLEQLREILAARTKGPWRANNKNALNEWLVYGPERQLYFSDGVTKACSDTPKPYPLQSTESNARSIVTLNNLAEEMLAVVEAARALVKELEEIPCSGPCDSYGICQKCVMDGDAILALAAFDSKLEGL